MSAADEVKALERERDFYVARGDKDRAAQVEAVLARVAPEAPAPAEPAEVAAEAEAEVAKPKSRGRKKAAG